MLTEWDLTPNLVLVHEPFEQLSSHSGVPAGQHPVAEDVKEQQLTFQAKGPPRQAKLDPIVLLVLKMNSPEGVVVVVCGVVVGGVVVVLDVVVVGVVVGP